MGSDRRRGTRPDPGRVRPVGGQRGLDGRQRLADQRADRHHPGRQPAGLVGRLGGVPGRQLARPDLRLRLPGEHGGLADVRVPAPAGAGRRPPAGPGHGHAPERDHGGIHPQVRDDVLGRPSGHPRRRGVQPGSGGRHQARRVLHAGLPAGEVDRRDRLEPGHDHPEAAGLLAGRRARLDAGHHRREERRAAAGQELRHAGREDHVLGPVHAQVVDAGGRRRGRAQPALLEHLGPYPGAADHPQGRAGYQHAHLRPAHRRDQRHLRGRPDPPWTSSGRAKRSASPRVRAGRATCSSCRTSRAFWAT